MRDASTYQNRCDCVLVLRRLRWIDLEKAQAAQCTTGWQVGILVIRHGWMEKIHPGRIGGRFGVGVERSAFNGGALRERRVTRGQEIPVDEDSDQDRERNTARHRADASPMANGRGLRTSGRRPLACTA